MCGRVETPMAEIRGAARDGLAEEDEPFAAAEIKEKTCTVAKATALSCLIVTLFMAPHTVLSRPGHGKERLLAFVGARVRQQQMPHDGAGMFRGDKRDGFSRSSHLPNDWVGNQCLLRTHTP